MKRLWRVNTHTFALAEFFRSAAQMSRRRLDCCQTLKFKVNISFFFKRESVWIFLYFMITLFSHSKSNSIGTVSSYVHYAACSLFRRGSDNKQKPPTAIPVSSCSRCSAHALGTFRERESDVPRPSHTVKGAERARPLKESKRLLRS